MKDAWEEEKQRLTAAIEREKKLRRDSEMRERRLLDDRLAEALNDGDGGVKVLQDAAVCAGNRFLILCLNRVKSKNCRMTCVLR